MLSDPKVWGDPETFRPERFLGPGADDLPNPLVIVFGYGMRCVSIVGFIINLTVMLE